MRMAQVTCLRTCNGCFDSSSFPSTKTMMTDIELLNHTGGFEYLQLKARSVILAATNQISPLQQAVCCADREIWLWSCGRGNE